MDEQLSLALKYSSSRAVPEKGCPLGRGPISWQKRRFLGLQQFTKTYKHFRRDLVVSDRTNHSLSTRRSRTLGEEGVSLAQGSIPSQKQVFLKNNKITAIYNNFVDRV